MTAAARRFDWSEFLLPSSPEEAADILYANLHSIINDLIPHTAKPRPMRISKIGKYAKRTLKLPNIYASVSVAVGDVCEISIRRVTDLERKITLQTQVQSHEDVMSRFSPYPSNLRLEIGPVVKLLIYSAGSTH